MTRSSTDVIVVYTSLGVRIALQETTSPVVFMAGDPVAAGFATSLARPGGQATGVSIVSTELIVKRLQLLRELAPKARRVVYLRNPSNPLGQAQFQEAQQAARMLGMRLLSFDAVSAAQLDAALRAIPGNGADAALITSDVLFYAHQDKISQALRSAGLPAIFSAADWQNVGVLISYGPRLREAAEKMAPYIDKIIKGAKPADLPIEQISAYELVVNVRVADELGLRVPQELLLRADQVIR
jgi:putative ABC transport system substrate-binding protein